MSLPNLVIAGCQKCGTTWLHHCLKKSKYIYAPRTKELNFFNQRNFADNLADYEREFNGGEEFQFRLESTPHYFRLPKGQVDVAKNIQSVLGKPKIILMFRNPIERYQSAYIHHMMKGRIPYSEVIDSITDDFGMLSLGRYASIYKHWAAYFEQMHNVLYDDVKSNKRDVISSVMNFLQVENDLRWSRLDLKINEREVKFRKLGLDTEWKCIPELSDEVKRELHSFYEEEIGELEGILDRSLTHWKSL